MFNSSFLETRKPRTRSEDPGEIHDCREHMVGEC